MLRLRRNDFDFIAVDELGRQRRNLAIDLATDRRVADVGMDGVGKIDRSRLARQRYELAFRREAEHLIVKQFELGMLEKFLRV